VLSVYSCRAAFNKKPALALSLGAVAAGVRNSSTHLRPTLRSNTMSNAIVSNGVQGTPTADPGQWNNGHEHRPIEREEPPPPAPTPEAVIASPSADPLGFPTPVGLLFRQARVAAFWSAVVSFWPAIISVQFLGAKDGLGHWIFWLISGAFAGIWVSASGWVNARGVPTAPDATTWLAWGTVVGVVVGWASLGAAGALALGLAGGGIASFSRTASWLGSLGAREYYYLAISLYDDKPRGFTTKDWAICFCTQALRRDPTLAAAYFLRGKTVLPDLRYYQAQADFAEAIRLEPRYTEALRERGHMFLLYGDTSRALADLDEAVRLDPADPETRWDRGRALTYISEDVRALADFDEAIRLDRTKHRYFSWRANVHVRLGQLDHAIADLTEAIQLSQNLPFTASDYYGARAKIHRARGDYGKAGADLAKVRELNPELFARLSQVLE
jgi:Flp pilus assembly protein TadD